MEDGDEFCKNICENLKQFYGSLYICEKSNDKTILRTLFDLSNYEIVFNQNFLTKFGSFYLKVADLISLHIVIMFFSKLNLKIASLQIYDKNSQIYNVLRNQ